MQFKPIIRIRREADPLNWPESRAILAIMLLSYFAAGIRLIFG